MTKPFESIDDLIRVLRIDREQNPELAVGIDGIDGSGKSQTGRQIASNLNFSFISLDCFLREKQGTYVEHLRLEQVSTAAQVRPIVIEGCCLLEVCERIGLLLTRLVYIKSIGKYGGWSDAEECDPDEPVEKLVARLNMLTKKFDRFASCVEGEDNEQESSGLSPFRKQIIEYHARYRPSQKADYIFHSYPDGRPH